MSVYRTLHGLILLVLCLLGALGCGGSQGLGVRVGDPVPQMEPAGLIFEFVKAQAPLLVPGTTTSIRFEFFQGLEGSGEPSQEPVVREFANTIVISPVSLSTRSVVITPLSVDGQPLFQVVANVQPLPGQTVAVDLSQAVPRTPSVLTSLEVAPGQARVGVGGLLDFSVSGLDQYGQPFDMEGRPVVWTSSQPGLAAIDPQSGRVSGLAVGQTTIRAEVDGLSAETSLSVLQAEVEQILSIKPASPIQLLVSENTTLVVTGRFTSGLGVPDRPLTNADGLTFVVDANAGVVTLNPITGELSGRIPGTTTILATVGSLQAAVEVQVTGFPWWGGSGNTVPVVNLGNGDLVVIQNQPGFHPFLGASVVDNQFNLNGGTLTIDASQETATNVLLQAPAIPAIGVVTGQSTSKIEVALNVDATPTAISQFLQGVQVSSTSPGAVGPGRLRVTVNDGWPGDSREGVAERPFTVATSHFIVGPDENFTTIQAAVDHVRTASPAQGPGALIQVRPGTYPENVVVADHANLQQLQLHGPNLHVPAAGQGRPNPARGDEAVVQSFVLRSADVHLTGFSITGHSSLGFGVRLRDSADRIELRNLLMRRASATTAVEGEAGIRADELTLAFGLVVEGCYISNWYNGLRVEGTAPPGMGLATPAQHMGLRIVGNAFENNAYRGVSILFPASDLVLSGNSFSDHQMHIQLRIEDRTIVVVERNDFLTVATTVGVRLFTGNESGNWGRIQGRNYWVGGTANVDHQGAGIGWISILTTNPDRNTSFP